MKQSLYILCLFVLTLACKNNTKTTSQTSEKKETTNQQNIPNKVIEVASFKGEQVTGVTVSSMGRIFVNFPRWRKNIASSVVELKENNLTNSYPNLEWNSWKMGETLPQEKFINVQSVVSFDNYLYVLDTRNPLFEGVLDAPRIFVFNLETDELIKTYILEKNTYYPDSYINDVRIDKKHNSIYCTDSGHPGIVVIHMETGTSKRVLNEHVSTTAEVSYLNIDGKKWVNTIHSDGIALNSRKLYYHALTGYNLYSIETRHLHESENNIEQYVVLETKTAAPDGMIFDNKGNLYFADLEHHKIQYRQPDGSIQTLVAGDAIKWADTFSIYDGYLYFTNSRIHEATGDISNMNFTLNKVKLPSEQ